MLYRRLVIIDIGSNSTKIVCYDVENETKIENVREAKWSNRIIQNIINNNNKISNDLIQKTIEWIKDQIQIIDIWNYAYNCNLEYFCFATEGLRRADNHKMFLEKLKIESGIQCRILSAKEEISAGIKAVKIKLESNDGLVFDIGGGSTEIGFYSDEFEEIDNYISMPIGSVSIMSNYDLDKKCSSEYIDKLKISLIDQYAFNLINFKNTIKNKYFNNCEDRFKEIDFIGIGGIVNNIRKLHNKGNSICQHEIVTINIKEVRKITYNILMRDIIDRKHILGIKSKRADILGAGSLILLCLMDILKIDDIFMTDISIRDGIAVETIENKLFYEIKGGCTYERNNR